MRCSSCQPQIFGDAIEKGAPAPHQTHSSARWLSVVLNVKTIGCTLYTNCLYTYYINAHRNHKCLGSAYAAGLHADATTKKALDHKKRCRTTYWTIIRLCFEHLLPQWFFFCVCWHSIVLCMLVWLLCSMAAEWKFNCCISAIRKLNVSHTNQPIFTVTGTQRHYRRSDWANSKASTTDDRND